MDIAWKDIVGHKENIARLRGMLREGRLPHALLFTGPEGVGKRRVAQALAAALLCERADGPCGACPSCQALLRDSHPDYHLVEPEARGKASRGIHIRQMREMQEKIARLPILSARRAVLIDDAELMGEAAANSLLKTLEEPTGEITFLLVSGKRSSLLETVVSRSMPMGFGMLTEEEAAGILMEKGIPAGDARELALLADGSIGRGESLYARDGMARRRDAAEMLWSLGTMSMDEVWQRGGSMGKWEKERILEWLMHLGTLLRDMLVLSCGGKSSLLYHRDLRPRLLEAMADVPEARIFSMLRLVAETQRRMQANVNLRLHVEGFLIRLKDLYASGR